MDICNYCEIVYESLKCPLCEADLTIKKLTNTIEKLEEEIKYIEENTNGE